MDIDKELAKANSLSELLSIANSLKGNGESVIAINRAMVKARKNLFSKTADIVRLQAMPIQMNIKEGTVSSCMFRVEFLESPKIIIEDNIFII